jgi:hypothetical protein
MRPHALQPAGTHAHTCLLYWLPLRCLLAAVRLAFLVSFMLELN